MPQVCVNGAKVQLQPMGPQQLLMPSSEIPAITQTLLNVDGKAALIPEDIQLWARTYTSQYINANFIGGQVQGSVAQVSALATQTTAFGFPAALQTTQIILTVSVIVKGIDPSSGSPDPLPQFPVQVMFTDPGQIKLTSL